MTLRFNSNSLYVELQDVHIPGKFVTFYLAIRLRALDFYAGMVGEGEARINYQRIEINSE